MNKVFSTVMGIDPGLGITGYSVLDNSKSKPRLVEGGCIKSNRNQTMEERLKTIYESIDSLVKQHKPGVMIVEDIYAHYNHPKTAIIMGHVRGVIFLAASMNNISVISYPANRIKIALTGNGHATKEQIQQTIKNSFNLAETPKPPDVADAIAVAMCYCGINRVYGN